MSWHGYASLQLAQAHFSQPLWTLDGAQRTEVERQLERKLQLEEQVLAHALAVDVMPSAAELHAARQALHERRERGTQLDWRVGGRRRQTRHGQHDSPADGPPDLPAAVLCKAPPVGARPANCVA